MTRRFPLSLGGRVVQVTTSDGIRLAGIAVPASAPPDRVSPGHRVTFVVAHGFTNSVSRPPSARLIGRWAGSQFPDPVVPACAGRDGAASASIGR